MPAAFPQTYAVPCFPPQVPPATLPPHMSEPSNAHRTICTNPEIFSPPGSLAAVPDWPARQQHRHPAQEPQPEALVQHVHAHHANWIDFLIQLPHDLQLCVRLSQRQMECWLLGMLQLATCAPAADLIVFLLVHVDGGSTVPPCDALLGQTSERGCAGLQVLLTTLLPLTGSPICL